MHFFISYILDLKFLYYPYVVGSSSVKRFIVGDGLFDFMCISLFIASNLFGSESDSQLFSNYYDLFGRNSVLDSEDGQIVSQPPVPAPERSIQQYAEQEFLARSYLLDGENVENIKQSSSLGSNKYCCQYCSKCFTRKRSLMDHHNIHTGKRPYVCEFCSKTFTQRASCNRHVKLCHQDILQLDFQSKI
ncbi:hypothetical protein AVEN_133724-1 [Araneus ventricosus]|uniref:C2H2-type domain-containing protein n=2 Tax=Araneidae TaxID=6913 RepID=A0A4Y2B793_ARAVE|nr:hypothetical protein AVEN_133724-1 [Araneus ventricosus]